MGDHKPVFSVNDFCNALNVSRAMLYLLWKRKQGPKYYYIGRRRYISAESARTWIKQLEAETNNND